MKLNDYEKSLVRGDYGAEAKKLMEVMLKVAEIKKATELIDVKHVMIATSAILDAGGEAGIELLCRLADSGVKFKVLTVQNPVSIDTVNWKRMHLTADYARTQMRGVRALKKLGTVMTLSCTPFLWGVYPRVGDHVSYVETSAVIFANSYFGALTNREADVSAIAAALCGQTPKYGYHLAENRRGQVLVTVKTPLKNEADYGALGSYVGKIVKDRIPVFKGVDRDISLQGMMQLGACLATTGSVALFHVFDVTPEIMIDPDKYGKENISEEIVFGAKELQNTLHELQTTTDSDIDLVAMGCPHLTIEKIREIATFLNGKKINPGTEVWVHTSAGSKALAKRTGYLQMIEKSGAKFTQDCCMITMPTRTMGFKIMATDSAKAQFYGSSFGTAVRFGSTQQCLNAAITGHWEG